eukprot:CAMPEP_0181216042 /NCGR_PEP_ID=MMETSP1096-20121128/26357_1 /TAXON_ID=156174 ORGANISM="Chrysochromulina ericina, Strain CCMP281" /NCGR_SAMPLE_ID=MMETSP1096 /ASSEMBLY_ACC=CAM_ASM_000453 /LENGTH=118 /DNA_ID=CAMNT_0023307981 /DNA_START=229 /DNA_END=586 /DNA_ORIENTATION=-
MCGGIATMGIQCTNHPHKRRLSKSSVTAARPAAGLSSALAADGVEVMPLIPQFALELVRQHLERLAELLELRFGLAPLNLAPVGVLIRMPLQRGFLVCLPDLLLRRFASHPLHTQQRV